MGLGIACFLRLFNIGSAMETDITGWSMAIAAAYLDTVDFAGGFGVDGSSIQNESLCLFPSCTHDITGTCTRTVLP